MPKLYIKNFAAKGKNFLKDKSNKDPLNILNDRYKYLNNSLSEIKKGIKN